MELIYSVNLACGRGGLCSPKIYVYNKQTLISKSLCNLNENDSGFFPDEEQFHYG